MKLFLLIFIGLHIFFSILSIYLYNKEYLKKGIEIDYTPINVRIAIKIAELFLIIYSIVYFLIILFLD